MDLLNITYRFIFSDGLRHEVALHLRADSLEPVGWKPTHPPSWTALEFHRCNNCPLQPDKNPYCPAALHLARLVDDVNAFDPAEPIMLEVVTADRTFRQSTTVQRALGSLIGLLISVSGCPQAAVFRPIARFHLPLASEEETIFRAMAACLLGQMFRDRAGLPVRWTPAVLAEIYSNLEIVNTRLAERLRAGGQPDAIVRPLREWDAFSGIFPLRIEEVLGRIEPLFAAFVRKG